MIETQQINQPQQGLESKVQSTIFLMIEEHHLVFYFMKLKFLTSSLNTPSQGLFVNLLNQVSYFELDILTLSVREIAIFLLVQPRSWSPLICIDLMRAHYNVTGTHQ